MSDTQKSSESENATVVLGLLEAVDASETVTQRSLANDLGVALGLVNTYLKRCVKKGLIKVQEAPKRRYAYYLTPQGFAEKSRLTANYLSASFAFMKRVKEDCTHAFVEAEARGMSRVVLVGASEISEIAALGAHDHQLDIVAVYDPGLRATQFAGLPVWRTPQDMIPPVDGAIPTVIHNQDRWLDVANELVGADRVVIPPLFGGAQRQADRTDD